MHDFAWALEELRSGARVQRAGWNGRGMFVVMHPGFPSGAPVNSTLAEALGEKPGAVVKFAPYFMIKGTDGRIGSWLAASNDLLAEDWQRFSVASPEAPVPAEATTDSGDEIEDEDDGVLDPAGSDSAAGDGPAPESD